MGVRSFDVMNLGRVGLLDPDQMGYKDSIDIIKDESVKIQKSFVKIGWYLKHIRDNELYKEEGYSNIWECAADQLGYSQSTASRFINICEKFSKGHNSPELDEKYVGFDKSQMIEMLPLKEEQLEKITPDMTVKQIRDIKTEKQEKQVTQDADVSGQNIQNEEKEEIPETETFEETENIPGQTSIEKDFPEYMPDSYATSHEDFHPPEENSDMTNIDQPVKKCITGFSRYGTCSCCGYEGVQCCAECKAECKESCNSRCGWLNNPYKPVDEPQSQSESEPSEIQPQPELAVLKNNEQRKEWLNNYKDWGLWYRDEHIDVNYYKYDFEDGSRLVVAEYPERFCYWNGEKQDECYYHLLEKNKKGYKTVYDEGYRHRENSETDLVEFLKSLQKTKQNAEGGKKK